MKILRSTMLRLATLLIVAYGSAAAYAAEEAGFEPIFDGKSLKGWDGNPQFWSVRDGAITGQTTAETPTQGNTFLVWRDGKVEDFELRLQFRIVGGNSGVQYRSREIEKWVISGYQADFDADGNWTGSLYEEKGRGILARRGHQVVVGEDGKLQTVGQTTSEEKILESIKKEGWNDYTIIARGNHLIQKVNGLTTVDVVDEQEDTRAMSGLLALQLHAGPSMLVQFKNIRLKMLQSEKPAALQAGEKQGKKKVVFVAGSRSHGYGSHEHYAGSVLLASQLEAAMPNFTTVVHRDGWPQDEHAFDGADAVVIYADGGQRHPVNDHLEQMDKLAEQGVGVVCLHYAVEVPKGAAGESLLDWIGGYFETNWSVNPHWTAKFDQLPVHAITRGVEPFEINDEWYYHMRFREGMEGITPILTDMPPTSTLRRPDGPHSGNPHVRAAVTRGEPQHVAWAAERPDGGRGFGFTGGHFHWNWGDPNFRKVVLNAIVWAAKADVPAGGVEPQPVTVEDLEANQDYPQPENFNRDEIRKQLEKTQPDNSQQDAKKKPAQQLVAAKPADLPRDSRASEDAVAGLDIAPGLNASLFAAEPTVRSLTNLDVDARGRVWVCEVMNYRRNNGSRPEGDRILILEDTDGDGRSDHTKVYYQGRDIDSAMGICVLGNQVIVSASPHVWVFTDENGDDRPDKKELLFTDTGQPQHDHSAHSFLFGPDGKLYWNFGNTGQSVHDAGGKVVVDQLGNQVVDNGKPYFGGMAFRCNLDGSEFEVLGHNFRNNYELTVDSFGTIWQSDNDDDGNRGVRINYVMEYGNYGYRDQMTGAGWREPRTNLESEIPLQHWHLNDPGVVPNLLQTGAGSPTGITVYEGRLLPKPFWDEVIHCDAGPNIVRAYPVVKQGAGYEAEVLNLVHGARDNWFRPADVCVAPDGSLFITDWYDPGVGGHAQGDLDRGRIFRIAPPNSPYRVPEVNVATMAGAIEALKSPSYSVRYLAWTALHERGVEAESALLELYRSADNPRHQARALWLLGKIEGRGEHYVADALQRDNPDLRIVGIRLSRELNLEMLPILEQLVRDPSPQVRREAAIALHGKQGERPARLWAELALQHNPESSPQQGRWYLEALGIGADGNWDAALDAWLQQVGDTWNTPAGRDIVWRSRAARTPQLLSAIISSGKTAVDELPRFFRAFDFQTGGEKQKALEQLVFHGRSEDPKRARLIAGESLQRLDAAAVQGNTERTAALERILDQMQGTDQFVHLVGKFQLTSRYPQLLNIAEQHPAEQIGVEAIRVLLERDERELIRRSLASENLEEATATAEVLGNSGDGRSADLLLPILNDENADAALRRMAARGLARSRNGAQKLLELARVGQIDENLKSAAAFQLNSAPWDDVRGEAAKLFPLPAAKDNDLPPIAQLLKTKGEAARGKAVFAEAGQCAKCHLVNGQGKQVGPELSEIGSKLSREALFESILYPSAGVSHNYETYALATADGNVMTGVITSRTDDAVTIVSADAISRTVNTEDIDALRKQTVSLMPADLQKTMTTQQLVDVVEYLSTLKKAQP